jgi:hypothetical protein
VLGGGIAFMPRDAEPRGGVRGLLFDDCTDSDIFSNGSTVGGGSDGPRRTWGGALLTDNAEPSGRFAGGAKGSLVGAMSLRAGGPDHSRSEWLEFSDFSLSVSTELDCLHVVSHSTYCVCARACVCVGARIG